MLRSALVGLLLPPLGVLGGVLLERRTTRELLAERQGASAAITLETPAGASGASDLRGAFDRYCGEAQPAGA